MKGLAPTQAIPRGACAPLAADVVRRRGEVTDRVLAAGVVLLILALGMTCLFLLARGMVQAVEAISLTVLETHLEPLREPR